MGNDNWYVAILILRFEFYDEKKAHVNRRCNVHENMHLIQASTPEDAYTKAMHLGQVSNGTEGIDDFKRKGIWIFEGLNELIPVYEKIEDGCEILWTKHYCSVKTATNMVKRKDDLQAFSD